MSILRADMCLNMSVALNLLLKNSIDGSIISSLGLHDIVYMRKKAWLSSHACSSKPMKALNSWKAPAVDYGTAVQSNRACSMLQTKQGLPWYIAGRKRLPKVSSSQSEPPAVTNYFCTARI